MSTNKFPTEKVEVAYSDSAPPKDFEELKHGDRALALIGSERVILTDEDVSPTNLTEIGLYGVLTF